MIEGKSLVKSDVIRMRTNINLNKKRIITGNLLDDEGNPKANVTIEVSEVLNNKKTVLGYTVTDENGYYLFAINVNDLAIYEFVAYK
jgi:5-hydroxyisourate hydrolase-like protein (transthyretin family)